MCVCLNACMHTSKQTPFCTHTCTHTCTYTPQQTTKKINVLYIRNNTVNVHISRHAYVKGIIVAEDSILLVTKQLSSYVIIILPSYIVINCSWHPAEHHWRQKWRCVASKPVEDSNQHMCLQERVAAFSHANHTRELFFFFCIPMFGEIFAYETFFFNPTIEVVIFRLRKWRMLVVVLLPAFTHLANECQDLLSPCNGMHVCTDKTWVYTPIQKSFREWSQNLC